MAESSTPASFSAYASKFLSNSRHANQQPLSGSQIFRASSPGSPSHDDPFLPSPSASRSQPRLAGSSRSVSPPPTPPFPGPGIDGIPSIADIADSQTTGIGLLFDRSETDERPGPRQPPTYSRRPVPDPYGPSSDSEGELEDDLDQVAAVRRSLVGPSDNSRKSRTNKGWLAYQSVFPSSSSSEATESEKGTESDDSDAGGMGVMGQSRGKPRIADDPFQGGTGSTLEEPLLGPDEITQMTTRVPVRLQVYHGRFGHWEREGLRKYKDSGFLALWLTSLLAIVIGLMFVWGSTDPPSESPNHRRAPSIIPLLPILLLLVIPTLILPPVFLFLLKKTVRPVLLATSISVPFALFVCGWWALGASFESVGDADQADRWWATRGLQLGAVVLWLLSAWFARLLWLRRRKLERTVTVVELSTHLLLTHPPLLLLTPLLLAVFAVTSIPFLTLLVRLAMIGYWRHPRENTYVFQIRPYAGWLIFIVTVVWVWSWGVIRGVGRVAVAAVIGEWYFHRQNGLDPLEVTTAAVHRATGTSLGSVCLGSLIVASVRLVGRMAAELKRITSPRSKVLPSALSFLSHLTPFFNITASVLDQLNGYALVYVGITGDAFWPSARRAVGLASRKNAGKLLDYTLIKLLLTLCSTATGLFTATAGYLYMAHSLGNPGYAPVAAILCGGVPFLAIRAGAAVLGDAADALFICHQIDGESGGSHCDEAKEAHTHSRRHSAHTTIKMQAFREYPSG
ncbi:CTL-like protein [Vanrija pseudolonga]|uniref:Protein PNS1 n=1 Tax=Vanrija pseudolonga TaxID=143232 RepID=A0AAF0Y3K3_9TREE|nr:CTL-like protein [Vanrija pseudolonga]